MAEPLARVHWGVALCLVLVAVLAHHARRDFIRGFFVDGPARPAPELTTGESSTAVEPVTRLRVVLVDGLGLAAAEALPVLDGHCRAGLDLRVDMGFPTVSLPVQHVLWTGLTQQQSGVMYRIAPLSIAPPASLPARIPQSEAVAESHPEIVHSFGFERAWPAVAVDELPAYGEPGNPTADAASWREVGFASKAAEVVAGPARLAFVHVLRVDEAGHAHGAASSAYDDAAQWADALLASLVRADGDPETRWVVLSDHGHRPAGGHGGAEDSIRIVRACVFGNVPSVASTGRMLHLVDLHRLLADSLALEPQPDSAGRPLSVALDHPRAGATLPRPGSLRWCVAIAWLLGGLAATAWASRGRARRLPWWVVVAYLSVVAVQGCPTLSHPMIYPPLGRDMLLGALPGVFVLTWTDARGYANAGVARRVIGHMALVVGSALAALTLCGGLERWVGLGEGPLLMPIWTAHASLLLTLTLLSAGATAALLLARPGVGALPHR